MKIQQILSILFLVLFTGSCSFHSVNNVSKIQNGMSKTEVLLTVGLPDKKYHNTSERWVYGGDREVVLVFLGGRVIKVRRSGDSPKGSIF